MRSWQTRRISARRSAPGGLDTLVTMVSRPTPHVDSTNCSAFSARLGEPLAGTAPVATTWLAIEQPGPWGARALTESHLDHFVGTELGRQAEGTGVRIALIRRVGHHALTDLDAPRRVLICSTRPGTASVRSFTMSDPRDLLDFDLSALGAAGSTRRVRTAPESGDTRVHQRKARPLLRRTWPIARAGSNGSGIVGGDLGTGSPRRSSVRADGGGSTDRLRVRTSRRRDGDSRARRCGAR